MSEEVETTSTMREFVGRLAQLGRGDLARLKRCAGRSLDECSEVYSLFYRLLPAEARGRDWSERDYFLVATLYGVADSGGGDMGEAMQRLRKAKAESAEALDRRLSVLLDCSRDELSFRLRQTVRMLASSEIGLDWAELLEDIGQWERPWKPTQKKWARSYFGRDEAAADAADDKDEHNDERAE